MTMMMMMMMMIQLDPMLNSEASLPLMLGRTMGDQGVDQKEAGDVPSISTMWCPSVISWFLNPINYSYKYHKP